MKTTLRKKRIRFFRNAAPIKKPNQDKFWSFRNTDKEGVGELTLYGEISSHSWWGDEITPKAFKDDLDALGDVSEIHVFINSPGGDVFAGQAIHSMLKRHKAKIVMYVDGWAASIASVVVMAGDVVIMPKNAMMMIHNPWTIAMGDAKAFRKLADDLDQVRESIVTTYHDKTGKSREEIIALLDKETLLTADEAVELGFADQIEEAKVIAASMKDGSLILNGQAVQVNGFKNIPNLVFASPTAPPIPPVTPETPTEPEEQQPQNGLLSLYQAKVQANKNRRF